MSGVKGRSGRKGSYAKQLSKALGLIDRDMPLLIQKLIELAQKGDREALIYLIDRRLGKPKASTEVDLLGGEELGSGFIVKLMQLIASKRREQIGQEGTNTIEGTALQGEGKSVTEQ